MDTKKVVTPEYLQRLLELYELKYKMLQFDAVIATDDNAYRFVLEHQSDLFNEAPLIFCGVSQYDPADIKGRPVTGVLELDRCEETLALKMQPQTQRLYMTCDYTVSAVVNMERCRQLIEQQYPGIPYEILRDLSIGQMRQRLRTLEADLSAPQTFTPYKWRLFGRRRAVAGSDCDP